MADYGTYTALQGMFDSMGKKKEDKGAALSRMMQIQAYQEKQNANEMAYMNNAYEAMDMSESFVKTEGTSEVFRKYVQDKHEANWNDFKKLISQNGGSYKNAAQSGAINEFMRRTKSSWSNDPVVIRENENAKKAAKFNSAHSQGHAIFGRDADDLKRWQNGEDVELRDYITKTKYTGITKDDFGAGESIDGSKVLSKDENYSAALKNYLLEYPEIEDAFFNDYSPQEQRNLLIKYIENDNSVRSILGKKGTKVEKVRVGSILGADSTKLYKTPIKAGETFEQAINRDGGLYDMFKPDSRKTLGTYNDLYKGSSAINSAKYGEEVFDGAAIKALSTYGAGVSSSGDGKYSLTINEGDSTIFDKNGVQASNSEGGKTIEGLSYKGVFAVETVSYINNRTGETETYLSSEMDKKKLEDRIEKGELGGMTRTVRTYAAFDDDDAVYDDMYLKEINLSGKTMSAAIGNTMGLDSELTEQAKGDEVIRQQTEVETQSKKDNMQAQSAKFIGSQIGTTDAPATDAKMHSIYSKLKPRMAAEGLNEQLTPILFAEYVVSSRSGGGNEEEVGMNLGTAIGQMNLSETSKRFYQGDGSDYREYLNELGAQKGAAHKNKIIKLAKTINEYLASK